MENFTELKLSPPLAQAIQTLGFEKPTPIQAQALPILLGERTDFLGMAATGTGKTAAFGIPLLEKLDAHERGTQGLVLCPTRELCVQVAHQINELARYTNAHALAIYGGAGYGEQIKGLKAGAPIVVATPGRLVDHLQRGTISLSRVRTVVLDEADEMISMGFKEALETILQQTPERKRNIWLFSATLSPTLRKVAETYMRDPRSAEINRREMLSNTVRQFYFTVREKNKPQVLCKLIDFADDFYGLIFCQTKALVIDLTRFLQSRGYQVDCLHGDMEQLARNRTMAAFRDRQVRILVCSDVAARGLDVKELTHVINYSIPRELDSYVHRIGRTARSGKSGLALSLVTPADSHLVARIEKITRSKMEPGTFPSQKEVSGKKLARLLPQLSAVAGHARAEAALDSDWKAMLDGMTKTEIAARFLALSFPDVFAESEQPIAKLLSKPRPSPTHQNPYHQRFRKNGPPRRFRRKQGKHRHGVFAAGNGN
jgi:ATP-dependent RNA helicase DeaD